VALGLLVAIRSGPRARVCPVRACDRAGPAPAIDSLEDAGEVSTASHAKQPPRRRNWVRNEMAG
jgi:hypothetical protein